MHMTTYNSTVIHISAAVPQTMLYKSNYKHNKLFKINKGHLLLFFIF